MQYGLSYYKDGSDPLKVETSYRDGRISSKSFCVKNGINVYTINRLAELKAVAYSARDRISDLFDVCFIVNNYYSDLSKEAIRRIKDSMIYKSPEQFDYLVATQKDELIDENLLAESFFKTLDKLGLLEQKEYFQNAHSSNDVRYI